MTEMGCSSSTLTRNT